MEIVLMQNGAWSTVFIVFHLNYDLWLFFRMSAGLNIPEKTCMGLQ